MALTEGELLTNLMPLLQLGWNFKKAAREIVLLRRVVVDSCKPEEKESILTQTL